MGITNVKTKGVVVNLIQQKLDGKLLPSVFRDRSVSKNRFGHSAGDTEDRCSAAGHRERHVAGFTLERIELDPDLLDHPDDLLRGYDYIDILSAICMVIGS